MNLGRINNLVRVSPKLTSDKALNQFSTAALSFSKFGIKLIRKYDPSPIILAFNDSSRLTTTSDGTAADENAWVKMASSNKMLSDLVHFFGDDVSVGTVSVSRSTAFMVIISTIGVLVGALSAVWNGVKLMISIRRFLLRIIIAAVGLQLGAMLMDKGLQIGEEFVTNSSKVPEVTIIERNLLLADWYESGFVIPDGATVTVKNGRMKMDPKTVASINRFVFKKKNANGDDEALSQYIIEQSKANNNVYQVAFLAPYTGDKKVTWRTKALTEYATYMADSVNSSEKTESKKGSDGDKKSASDMITSAGYTSNVRNSHSGSGREFTYTGSVQSTGSNYGISPIAAYNLLNTNFANDSMIYRDNSGLAITIPSVAVDVATGASASFTGSDGKAKSYMDNPLLRFLISVVMMVAGAKALVDIFMAGFGGVFKGGAKTSIGSAEGLGEFIGGIVALLVGAVGISFIMTLAIVFTDIVWSLLHGLFQSKGADNVIEQFVDSLGLRDGSGISGWFMSTLADMLQSAVGAFMTIAGFFIIPKFVKIPIQAFGQYCSTIPSTFAARARMMGDRFVSDQHQGGGKTYGGGSSAGSSASGIGSGVSNAVTSGAKDAAKSISAGLGVAGAVGGLVGGKIGDSIAKHNENKSEQENNQGDVENSDEKNNDLEKVDNQAETMSQQESIEGDEGDVENVDSETQGNTEDVDLEKADMTSLSQSDSETLDKSDDIDGDSVTKSQQESLAESIDKSDDIDGDSISNSQQESLAEQKTQEGPIDLSERNAENNKEFGVNNLNSKSLSQNTGPVTSSKTDEIGGDTKSVDASLVDGTSSISEKASVTEGNNQFEAKVDSPTLNRGDTHSSIETGVADGHRESLAGNQTTNIHGQTTNADGSITSSTGTFNQTNHQTSTNQTPTNQTSTNQTSTNKTSTKKSVTNQSGQKPVGGSLKSKLMNSKVTQGVGKVASYSGRNASIGNVAKAVGNVGSTFVAAQGRTIGEAAGVTPTQARPQQQSRPTQASGNRPVRKQKPKSVNTPAQRRVDTRVATNTSRSSVQQTSQTISKKSNPVDPTPKGSRNGSLK